MPESCAPTAVARPSDEAGSVRPRPGRRRSGGRAATVAGLVLLAAGAAGCSSSGSQQPKPDAPPTSEPTPAPPTEPTSGQAAGSPKGLRAPARIASLHKSPQQDAADGILSAMSPGERKKSLAVQYEESAQSPRFVLAIGQTGQPVLPGAAAAQLKQVILAQANGAKFASAASMPAGSAGGTAECAPVNSAQFDCGWISGTSRLVLIFSGYTQDQTEALMPKFLTAMVRT